MLTIAGVVILYDPDKQVLERIKSYLPFLEKLYVLDNSENPIGLSQEFSSAPTIIYTHDGENKGISRRLNETAENAVQQGLDWLLTMDQDSYFPENAVQQYFQCIERYSEKDKTSMFGVQFLNSSLTDTCAAIEVPHLITSGSVLNLKLFKEVGAFDEALFIDKVDHEYCLRSRLLNYKIVQFNNIFLHHNLGNTSYHRSLKNLCKTPRVLHSPIRMYYIVRNYFYLHSKYKGQFEESFKEMRKELFNRTKNNLLYGRNKIQLLQFIMKGYIDFKTGKMGKIKN